MFRQIEDGIERDFVTQRLHTVDVTDPYYMIHYISYISRSFTQLSGFI